jgi:hypothetical protein
MAVVAMDTTPNTKAKNLVNFTAGPLFYECRAYSRYG